MCVYIYITKYNLVSPYNVTCVYVCVRTEHLGGHGGEPLQLQLLMLLGYTIPQEISWSSSSYQSSVASFAVSPEPQVRLGSVPVGSQAPQLCVFARCGFLWWPLSVTKRSFFDECWRIVCWYKDKCVWAVGRGYPGLVSQCLESLLQ